MGKITDVMIYGYVPKEYGGKVSGGVATYIGNLVRVLTKRGINVGVIAENVSFFKRNYHKVRIYGPPNKFWFWREILYSKTFQPNSKWLWNSRMGLIFKDFPSDIFYSHIPHSPANFVENLKDKKFIVMFHSLHAYEFERDEILKERYLRNMEMSFKKSDAVIYPSNKLKEKVENLFGKHPRSFVIHPLVKVPEFNYTKEQSRKYLGIDEDSKVVGFAGIFTGRKGEEILIRSSVGKDWIILFAGSGPNLKNAIDICKDMNVKAVFLGDIHGDKLWHFYNAIDIFALPSKSETFGIAVVEAMMFGKTVVVSKEVPEEVAPEGIAIRVGLDSNELSEAISEAFRNPLDPEPVRKFATRFSDEERFAKTHIEVFKGI